MNKIATIAALTWKSAFRYRLFWIVAALLATAVVGLPLMLKSDDSAKGLVQILLTYTLGAVSALLGLATLWISCGTMARDIEECQAQMVAVKPIARWQIWLGKWLGIMMLNAALLALAGGAIFILLEWRASRLPAGQQKILHDEIFVARAATHEPVPDVAPIVEQLMSQRHDLDRRSPEDIQEIRKQIRESVVSRYTEVPSGYPKGWGIDLHSLQDRLRDQPLLLRIKFLASNPNEAATYLTYWLIGPPDSPRRVQLTEILPANSFQEFEIPPNMLDAQGRLWIEVVNANDISLVFPLREGLELLYPESTFGVNFIRGLAVIFCWLALLASIGLAAASFLSFPVAAFVSLSLLFVAFSSGTVADVVQEGTVTGYDSTAAKYGHSPVDLVVVPIFRGILDVLKLVQSFSPIDNLSSGQSITWAELGKAAGQIVVLIGGFFCLSGIILFTRRELATAQGNT